jgi:hypothetical protein
MTSFQHEFLHGPGWFVNALLSFPLSSVYPNIFYRLSSILSFSAQENLARFWTEPNPLLSLKSHPVASRFIMT